jgi:AMP nucleosidase
VVWAVAELRNPHGAYTQLTLPGGAIVRRGDDAASVDAALAAAPWHRFQMPAYNLMRSDDEGGITIVNIGVGPSNAKNATDHLAVLRPHCWLTIGHCGGLRQSQTIGDYVLAHGYLRRDRILDDLVPPEIPVPALAEVQMALQEARPRDRRARRCAEAPAAHRHRRQLRRSQLGAALVAGAPSHQPRDAPSPSTWKAPRWRPGWPHARALRAPRCASPTNPLHGEIKLPGAATRFYQRAVGEHLQIGLETVNLLRSELASLHSRKLRSFDEPPFR